jgi:hypothetical protein
VKLPEMIGFAKWQQARTRERLNGLLRIGIADESLCWNTVDRDWIREQIAHRHGYF